MWQWVCVHVRHQNPYKLPDWGRRLTGMRLLESDWDTPVHRHTSGALSFRPSKYSPKSLAVMCWLLSTLLKCFRGSSFFPTHSPGWDWNEYANWTTRYKVKKIHDSYTYKTISAVFRFAEQDKNVMSVLAWNGASPCHSVWQQVSAQLNNADKDNLWAGKWARHLLVHISSDIKCLVFLACRPSWNLT